MPYFTATGAQIRLDYQGIGKIMRSRGMQSLMAEAANALAQQLGSAGIDKVWVNTYTTDRGAASVTIADQDLEGAEAKYGVLSGAARAIGLEVKQGKP